MIGGVGGPAREIARFSGCKVIGLNNNAYQIERARKHTNAAQLDKQVEFVKGNFMERKLTHILDEYIYFQSDNERN